MRVFWERIYNGLIKENPTFVLMLGMCPTLAVTTSASNGLGMGLTTMVVLALSNSVISAMRRMIPERVRIPAYIVIVATMVTIVQLLLQAYLPALNQTLGIYIPLIVVNCIILGRAEAYASKSPVFASLGDGIGMGLGFTLGLTSIGLFRELLGAGTVFGRPVLPAAYEPISIFVLAPGAFFVLAMLVAFQNRLKRKQVKTAGVESEAACSGQCAACSGISCMQNHEALEEQKEQLQKERREQAEREKAEKLAKAAAAKAAQASAEKPDTKEAASGQEASGKTAADGKGGQV